jgi:hypothetical protein
MIASIELRVSLRICGQAGPGRVTVTWQCPSHAASLSLTVALTVTPDSDLTRSGGRAIILTTQVLRNS